ncbi:MAG: GrpB family protein [Thermomicrobiales bacterium]
MDTTSDDDAIGTYEYIRYEDPAAAFRPYDPRCPAVARRVIALIRGRMPEARVEHVGSTAIPGCDGKGVVDLMLVYPPGRLSEARDALDGLGFQRQRERPWSFTEERPVRIGTIEHDGETFRLHVHVIAADAPEAADQIGFRDRLRADPALVAEYVARKRAVLTGGVRDANEYNQGKEVFIQRVLGDSADRIA